MIAMREPGGMMGAVTADPAAQRYVWRIANSHIFLQSLTILVISRDGTAGATALAIEMDIDDETSP
jgi:hypothetical protein